MLTVPSLLAFAGTLLLMVMTPGPGVMAAVARALGGGARPALFFVAGIVVGDLLFCLVALLGLATIAESDGYLLDIVKIVGAIYLLWLAWTLWRSDTAGGDESTAGPAAPLANVIGGTAITLSNPKVILFYAALLPSFVEVHLLSRGDMILLLAVVAVIVGVPLCGYILLADRVRRLFVEPAARRRLNRAAAVLVAVTAVVIALSF